MSEKRARRERLNEKMRYISIFEKWIDEEPPIILFRAWRRWKKARPAKPW